MRAGARLGSRGALWRCHRPKRPVLPQGALDPDGLTGTVDRERGFVLARRLSGERALPTVGRAVPLSPERLCRHVLVCGATGSGKTETLLRLAWAVARCTGAPVFYLDGKGDRDTARRFCALMADAGRSTRVFPGDAFDGWRGEPHEIQGRLMQIVDYATVGPASWYRDIAKTTLGLVCGHPQGPPRSSREALARMDLPLLRGAHPGSSAAGALSEAQVNQIPGAASDGAGAAINLRWQDIDLDGAALQVPVSKTEAGKRTVHLEPELVTLLREHKLASRWSQPEDFVFPGRRRDRPRERNSVRTRVLYTSVSRANEVLETDGQAPIPPASPSMPCAAHMPHCAPSWASILRSPPRRWVTPTPA